jgi:hypothetical protein
MPGYEASKGLYKRSPMRPSNRIHQFVENPYPFRVFKSGVSVGEKSRIDIEPSVLVEQRT